MKKNDLSVVVLSFNTKEITDKCLSNLKESIKYCNNLLKNDVEVIVIDNASTDGSHEMIQKKHSWVKFLPMKENTGFSRGNNIGMKKSKNPFILLLNSDAYVNKETLYLSLRYFEEKPECDVLGCKLILPNGKQQISVGYLPNPINTIFWISGLSKLPLVDLLVKPIHPNSVSAVNKEKKVEWAMGAFLILKREVFEKTKGFNEEIFMYGEEVEWCKRIKDMGFVMYFVPKISATHLDKASSKFNLEKPLINEFRGIKVYFRKHYRSWYSLISLIIKVFLLVRILIFGLLLDRQRVRAYTQALFVV